MLLVWLLWWGRGERGLGTLVALGEETKGVHLSDEIDHAGPPAESKPHHQHPHHHERVHHVHGGPARYEEGWLLRGVLQSKAIIAVTNFG